MKNLLLGAFLAVLLSGCSAGAGYLINAAEVAGTYEQMQERHDPIVAGIKANKDVFKEGEIEVLRFQNKRVEAVRVHLASERAMDSSLEEAILNGSNLLDHYFEIRDSYELAIFVIEPHLEEFPLELRFNMKKQIADAKRLDKAVMALLSSPDGIDHSEAIKAVMKLLGAAAKLAIAVS